MDAPPFLATTATRLAVNLAQSARSPGETYVGPELLPEPVETSTDPLLQAERGEALEFAILKLSPAERAAYEKRSTTRTGGLLPSYKLEEANTRRLLHELGNTLQTAPSSPSSEVSSGMRRFFKAGSLCGFPAKRSQWSANIRYIKRIGLGDVTSFVT